MTPPTLPSCRVHPSLLHPPTGSDLTVIFQEPYGCATQSWSCCLILLLLTSSLAFQNISRQMHFAQQTPVVKFSSSCSLGRSTEAPSNVLHYPRRCFTRVRGDLCTPTRTCTLQAEPRGASRDTEMWPAMPSTLRTWLLSGQACWTTVWGQSHGRQSPTGWPQSNFGKYGKQCVS